MSAHPSHRDDLPRLKKIEGQVKGIQKMIDQGRYCVEILTQLNSVVGAIRKVEEHILARHLRSCVLDSLGERDRGASEKKVEEMIDLLGKFRKHG